MEWLFSHGRLLSFVLHDTLFFSPLQLREIVCQNLGEGVTLQWGVRMIAYDLICSNGHLFECWFKDSSCFEEQHSAGIINCPICDDTQVVKTFSPFMIKKSNGERKKGEEAAQQALQLIHEYVDKHFEDVGDKFAKEALKIHHGEVERKDI